MKGNFDNTGKLVRFMLRRERIIALIWILILVLFSIALAPGLESMFPDDAARENVAAIYDNPLMVSMMGHIYGDSTGAMYSSMMLLWYIIAVAVMNIFIVVRHTRADEERWRAEVIRSLPVGKLANIHATMITALIINALLAIFTGLGIAVTGVNGMDFAGSMLYGAVSGATGLVFAALTAVFCQLSSSAGGAVGFSFLGLGGFYMLRFFGDVDAKIEFLSFISPLGLAQRSKVYVTNNPLPLIILLLEVVVISALAYKLNAVRDLGQGFIPAKPGRKEAKRSLLSPFGLSLRLLKKMLIIWLIVMFMAGASYGSVIGDIDQFVADSPEYLRIVGVPEPVVSYLESDEKSEEAVEIMVLYFGVSKESIEGKSAEEVREVILSEISSLIVSQFAVFVTSMMTLIALVPLLIAVLKLRAEEKDGRLENVISRSVPRMKYLAGFVIIAFILSALLQLATATGLYFAADASEASNPFAADGIGALIKAYMVFLPAMWLMLGLAVLLVGLLPKVTGAIWGYYGFICFMVFMGSFPDLFPGWVVALSPFKHVPKLPLEEMSFTPLIIMLVIAAVLTTAGFITYRRRDLLTH